MEEAELPRPRRGAALAEIAREDLDLYAVSDLRERIAVLESEIARARQAIERKTNGRSAADALFTFSKG